MVVMETKYQDGGQDGRQNGGHYVFFSRKMLHFSRKNGKMATKMLKIVIFVTQLSQITSGFLLKEE